MRLLALTYGTEGDTRPLAMLCHGLIGAGHTVTLLADGGTWAARRPWMCPTRPLKVTSMTKWSPWCRVATVLPPPVPVWHGWRCSMSAAGCARPMRPQKAAMRF